MNLTNPTSKSSDNMLPFVGISHDNFSALIVISSYSHFKNIIGSFNVERFINFILEFIKLKPEIRCNLIINYFNRKSMSIPSESSLNMIALLMCIASDNIFNCASQDVSIMRKTRGKWRSIVESVSENSFYNLLPIFHQRHTGNIPWLSFRLFQTIFKNFLLIPVLENVFLFIWEADVFSYSLNITSF